LRIIYLDHNATTRPCAGALAAAQRAALDLWHNPSSIHRPGQAARHGIELARESLATLLGVRPREITFTSGGTESIHLAIRGLLGTRRDADRPAIITARTEHAAVRDLAEELEKIAAARIVYAPLDASGVVDAQALAGLLAPDTALVSIQWANNETGAIQPVEAIHHACRAAGVPFHCDAVQWIGKEPVTDARGDEGILSHRHAPGPPCDLLSVSAHKFGGLKGAGALWVRSGIRLRPVIPGSQELGRRGGTENVPGILALGAAAEEARAWLADPAPRAMLASMRDRLESAILARVPGTVVNGPRESTRRLWNTTNIGFPRLEAEALLLALSERGVCASAGAACSSGSLEPSPVLLSMGVPPEVAHGSLRFSIGKDTNADEIDRAADIIADRAAQLRRSLPV